MTVPLYVPGKGWFVEERDDCGNLIATRLPGDGEQRWLDRNPVLALDMRAEFELLENRRLLSDSVVVEALRNLRTARM